MLSKEEIAPVLVISPVDALMKDLEHRLQSRGDPVTIIRFASINAPNCLNECEH